MMPINITPKVLSKAGTTKATGAWPAEPSDIGDKGKRERGLRKGKWKEEEKEREQREATQKLRGLISNLKA